MSAIACNELRRVACNELRRVVPRNPISIRAATIADIPFIDRLQKKYHDAVGWMPRKQLEEKIGRGDVLIAEEKSSADCADGEELHSNLRESAKSADHALVGYVISQDRYFKRDDVGIVYQLMVVPGKRRSLIGAMLIKEVFERSAYGCRLFCCWCAQDLQANHFWESLGFVPLAFRTGARGRGKSPAPRMHIFWQRRIRQGDTSTPFWFPSQTAAGA